MSGDAPQPENSTISGINILGSVESRDAFQSAKSRFWGFKFKIIKSEDASQPAE